MNSTVRSRKKRGKTARHWLKLAEPLNPHQFPNPQSITASRRDISSWAVQLGSRTGKSDVWRRKKQNKLWSSVPTHLRKSREVLNHGATQEIILVLLNFYKTWLNNYWIPLGHWVINYSKHWYICVSQHWFHNVILWNTVKIVGDFKNY